MKDRLKILTTYPFLISLFLLLLNDLVLKKHFGNIITGKLSDFTGLFIFPIFISVLIPKQKRLVYILTFITFIFWKSSFCQPIIDFFNSFSISVYRVVDYTDFIALIVLPFSYSFCIKNKFRELKINPYLICLISFFAITATSLPSYELHFVNPQYLLIKKENDTILQKLIDANHLEKLGDKNYRGTDSYDDVLMIDLDTLLLFKIVHVNTNLPLPIENDDYEIAKKKNQLVDIVKMNYGYHYRPLSMTFELKQDSFAYKFYYNSNIEYLNFFKGRLNGQYISISNQCQNITKGQFCLGLETGIWYYLEKNINHFKIVKKEFYRNGELIETTNILDNKSSTVKNQTRASLIFNVKLTIILFLVFFIIFCFLILSNNRPSHRKVDNEYVNGIGTIVVCSLVFPLIAFIISRILIFYIPNMITAYFISLFFLFLFDYVIGVLIFLIFLLVIKLKKVIDVFWLAFAFLSLILLINQIYYLYKIT